MPARDGGASRTAGAAAAARRAAGACSSSTTCAGLLDQPVVRGRPTGSSRRRPCSRGSGRSARRRSGRARSCRARLLHQLDAPARRVHLLVPEDVRRAGRQAEAAVDAVVGSAPRSRVTPSTPGRVERALQRAAAAARRRRRALPRDRCGTYATPAAGRTTASSSVERRSRGRRGAKRSRPSASAWRSRASSQTDASASAPPTSARGGLDLRRDGAPRSPRTRTATRPGWRTSSALGCSGERRSARTTSAGVARLDDDASRVAAGSGCRRSDDPRDQRERAHPSRRRACRGRSRRRSSRPCRRRSRSCRRRARA